MKKIDFNFLYERTHRLLMKPDVEWRVIFKECDTIKEVFQNYFIPLSAVASIFVLLLSFFHYTPIQAVGYAFIHFLSITIGTGLAYLLMREYLTSKFSDADTIAQNLTVYSAAVFIVFHSIGDAFGNGFLNQLFILLSFIFVRTLYIGISQTTSVPTNQRTNIFIIGSLAIICIPIILKHLLMIIFRISAFNV